MANDEFLKYITEVRMKDVQDIKTVQSFLENKYSEYNMRIYVNESYQVFEVCFKILFTVNGIHWKIEHSCECVHRNISISELNKMIDQIEKKIQASYNVKQIITKADNLIPMICPCCGGKITESKCEYCDTEFR